VDREPAGMADHTGGKSTIEVWSSSTARSYIGATKKKKLTQKRDEGDQKGSRPIPSPSSVMLVAKNDLL